MKLIDLFFAVARMSGVALAVTVAVACVQLLFCWSHRLRRRILYYMMFLVLFRMVCPVSISAPFSIFNLPIMQEYSEKYVPLRENLGLVGDYEVVTSLDEDYEEILAETGAEPELVFDKFYAVSYTYDENGGRIPALTFADRYEHQIVSVWLGGMALLLLYGVLSCWYLRRRVRTATLIEDNIYETDRIQTPFILGFFKPKIYLPLGLSPERRHYVIYHEKMHIQHGDHIVKALVYLLMCVHWFNLLLWIYFYRMFAALLEDACDDDVIYHLGETAKADYAETLVELSRKKHFIGAIPCAFGEGDAEGRVKTVMKHRNPSPVLTAICILFFAAAILCFSTNAIY